MEEQGGYRTGRPVMLVVRNCCCWSLLLLASRHSVDAFSLPPLAALHKKNGLGTSRHVGSTGRPIRATKIDDETDEHRTTSSTPTLEKLYSVKNYDNTSRSSRRLFFSSSLIAAGTFLAGSELQSAQASAAPTTTLPWVKDPLNPKRSSLKIGDAEREGYNLTFVTYLTRFLLNFDPAAQQWWIDGAKEIPARATADQILEIRRGQFSKLSASVELGLLQEFTGPEGPRNLLKSLLKRFCSPVYPTATGGAASGEGNTTAVAGSSNDAKQQRISRETKEARRQLALLFGLLQDTQPTSEITKVLASVDNGSVKNIELLEPIRGLSKEDTDATEVQLPPPQAGDGFTQALAKVRMEPTGNILRIDVISSTTSNKGNNQASTFSKPPTIIISPPHENLNGRAAQAVAKLRKGSIAKIELTDPGEGYTEKDQILVTVQGSPEEPQVEAKAFLEMVLTGIDIVDPGSGYAVEKPLRVTLKSDKDMKTIGLAYLKGQRASFTVYRILGDNKVRSFERDLDEKNGGVVSGTASGGALPPLPFTSKASSSQQLLTLLPEGFGLEYSREKKRYFLTVDNEMVKSKYASTPSTGRLVPDFGPRGESPVQRNMAMDVPTFLRLCISGAICSSGVHLVLTPLDVVKTKVQTAPKKYPTVGSSFATIFKEEGAGTLFTGWLPTITGNFLGGGVLYATTEYIRRTLTEAAGYDAASLEVLIILTAAGISSALAATVFCPFETVRIRMVAQPEYGSSALQVTKRMIQEEGIRSLVNTIPVFLVKQVPYAMVKFTVFDLSTEYMYAAYPAAQEDLKLSLLISLIGGILGGVAAATVSNPADAVISELKKAKSDQTPQQALQALLDRSGVAALFTGLPLRMVFYSLNASLQFLIFDGIRFSLGIGPDDLRLYLDVLGGALTEKGTIA